MLLDVKTMMLTNAALLFMGAAASYAIWRRQPAFEGLLWWSRGTGLVALGVLLAAWIGPTPEPPLGPAAALAMVLGAAITCESMRRFNGKANGLRLLLLGVLLFVATLIICVVVGVPVFQRAALISFALSIFAALAALEAWRGGAERLRSRFVMSTIFGVTAVLLLARASLGFLFPSSSSAATFYDPFKGFVPLVVSVTIVCFNIAIMLMASELLSLGARKLALTDDLTGLPNRRSLVEELDRLARHVKHDTPAAILMMDLDHFAEVNRHHGHAGGDKALVAFAGLLRQHLRETDVIARYGGEEFCAFLPGTGLDDAACHADRLRAALAGRRIEINGQTFGVTVSIGVAAFQGGEPSDSFRRADEALYRAKACGRDTVVTDRADQCSRGAPRRGTPAAGRHAPIAGGEGTVPI